MIFEFNEKKWKKINSFFDMDTLKIAIIYVILVALLCAVFGIVARSVQSLNVVFLDLAAGVVLFYEFFKMAFSVYTQKYKCRRKRKNRASLLGNSATRTVLNKRVKNNLIDAYSYVKMIQNGVIEYKDVKVDSYFGQSLKSLGMGYYHSEITAHIKKVKSVKVMKNSVIINGDIEVTELILKKIVLNNLPNEAEQIKDTKHCESYAIPLVFGEGTEFLESIMEIAA